MLSKNFWLSEHRPSKIHKIVSLVPSQTELLFDLGLESQLSGITLFCIHPSHLVKNITKVGGTKSVKIDRIKQLKPDIIIANKEENEKDSLLELAKYFPVYVTDVANYDDAIDTISDLSILLNKEIAGQELIQSIQSKFSAVGDLKQFTVVYLIWKEPYMTIGGDTFISSMMEKAGFLNCYKDALRYPQISLEDIKRQDADYVFLSSEPYPFKEKNKEDLVTSIPLERIVIVDGESFSWYGSRMNAAATYFNKRDFLP